MPLVRALQQLGMPLYMCQPPTGYKDTADAWVNTGALVSRMNFALTLAERHGCAASIAGAIAADAPDDARSAGDVSDDDARDDRESDRRAEARRRMATRSTLGSPEFQTEIAMMLSRRVFLKNGAFALVSLGFAPSFLARTASRPAGATRASS